MHEWKLSVCGIALSQRRKASHRTEAVGSKQWRRRPRCDKGADHLCSGMAVLVSGRAPFKRASARKTWMAGRVQVRLGHDSGEIAQYDGTDSNFRTTVAVSMAANALPIPAVRCRRVDDLATMENCLPAARSEL